MTLLRSTGRTTFCEFKGVASYFHLLLPEWSVPEVAWTYPSPSGGYEELEDRLAFYPGKVACVVAGERVRAQEGDFYGGWITSEITGPFKGGLGTRGW